MQASGFACRVLGSGCSGEGLFWGGGRDGCWHVHRDVPEEGWRWAPRASLLVAAGPWLDCGCDR